MKIHFSWTISVETIMELESIILIRSSKDIDCHHTIWVQENEYKRVNYKLKTIAEVLPYKTSSELLEPWAITPKWDIEPKGDVIVGLDADVMIWNKDSVIQIANDCLKNEKIYGTIGYVAPFDISEWIKLFSEYNLEDDFSYKYTNTLEKCPYYINNGVVMMPNKFLTDFRNCYKKWLFEVNKFHYNLYYMCQVATTMAIKESKLPVVAMSRYFNYTEVDNPELELDKAVFLHYNETRNQLPNIKNIKNKEIRDRFLKLVPTIKLI